MDLVKTYLTVNIEKDIKISISQQTLLIFREHGFFGLYKGWTLSMVGIAPFIGIKMASFDLLMQTWAPKKDDPYVVYWNLLLGATAGTIAMVATYPTDLTRRLLQLNGTPGHTYNGIVDCCQ